MKFVKVRSLFCIFRLTSPVTCDSLLWWSFCGHIVVARRRLDTWCKGMAGRFRHSAKEGTKNK
jgi:hypothetical protein